MDKIKSHPKAAESVNVMDPDNLLDTTKSISDTTRTGMNLIDKATETDLGKNVATALNGLFLHAFGDLVEYGLVEQSKIRALAQAVATNVEKVPGEKRTLENKMQILKDIEELRFQLDDETITQLFINLISNSFNRDFNDDFSPLFAQMLGSMSHKTAVFLSEWQRVPTEASPYTNIKRVNADGSLQQIHRSIVSYSDGISRPFDDSINDATEGIAIQQVPVEISELEYFGLIKVDESRALHGANDMYQAISKQYHANAEDIVTVSLNSVGPDIKSFPISETGEYPNDISFTPGMIELTPLGKMLCNIIFSLHH